MDTTDKLELCSARHYGYRVFQRLMGDKPTPQLFAAIDVELLREAFAIIGVAQDDFALDALVAALAGANEQADQLSSQYARVFVGPAALPAPPWESVYRDHRRMVMTRTTLSVREAYRAQGFIPQRYPHVPDDHLALELDFLAELASGALEACQAGDEQACLRFEAAGHAFACEHLGTWAADFARDVRENADAPFYATAAAALATFVAADVRG